MSEDVDFSSARRDPIASPEQRRSIALDADVLRGFEELALRSGSANPEALIHAVLRDHLRRSGEPLERTLRRVLREELRKAG